MKKNDTAFGFIMECPVQQAAMCSTDPGSNIQLSTSNIENPTSNIQHHTYLSPFAFFPLFPNSALRIPNSIFRLLLILVLFSLPGLTGCNNHEPQNTVQFPVVSEPIQITRGGKEHFYASYYGINSFSASGRYATVLETDVKYRIPAETDTAVLGLVDLETLHFKPIAKTTAWNFQQGCMAHWLATSPDSLIIYNDLRNGKFVSVILNVHTGKELKTIPYPVSAVSHDGKKAVSINFGRIRVTRPDYGYGGGGQDAMEDTAFPDDDGIRVVNLETGQARLIVPLARIKSLVPEISEGGIEYFNHTLFSRGDSKVFWLARARPDWNTTSFTVDTDGSGLRRCFPDGWEGSHFDWLDDNRLMITAKYKAKQYGHVLFTVGKDDYVRLGKGALDFDAHGTFSPDGNWMVTDSYPSEGLREQKIFLMDMKTQSVLSLGRFAEPAEFHGGWRCDLHCRWSPGGDMIGFNSTRTGSRQAYIMKLDFGPEK